MIIKRSKQWWMDRADKEGDDPIGAGCSGFTVLVTGSRDWTDHMAVADAIAAARATVVIEGGARGADRCAYNAALYLHIRHVRIDADWALHGRRAGPIRNAAMLDLNPGLVLAFHDEPRLGLGTRDCVRGALERGIRVLHYRHVDLGTHWGCERVELKELP